MKYIFVIAEIVDGLIQPVTLELTAAAIKILELEKTGKIRMIVLSDDPLPFAKKIAKQTGMDVTGLKIIDFKGYDSDVYKKSLFKLIKTMQPSHILAAHTSQGRDFTPGLAIKLNAASIAGINGIRLNEKGLLYSRPVLDNTKNMIVRPAPDIPLILTVLPGVFKLNMPDKIKKGRVDIFEVTADFEDHRKKRFQHKQVIRKICKNKALQEAKIIVSVGQGIGKKENLGTIFQFAQYFSSSAVGASRPLVDMGWMGHEHQVGITGVTILPKLYIACGISGSSQHLAGIKDAEFIVSINNNPDAPIFRHSDLCIVEDIFEFIQVFLEQAKTEVLVL
jgi:electron transfer flavoprotein alpha subunit